MRNKKFTILSIAIMAFIFSQSALPADLSSAESGVIVDWILKVMEGILPVDRESLVFAVRKGAHFTEYTILGCSLMAAVKEWMEPSGNQPGARSGASAGRARADREVREACEGAAEKCGKYFLRKNCLIAWLIGTGYAVTDEIHQNFVPGRSCELRDVGIDSCGVLAGVAVIALAGWLRGQARRDRRAHRAK